MESGRPATERVNERPLTRWRRDQEDFSRPQSRLDRPSSSAARASSKIDRPISRRGIKNDDHEFGLSRELNSAVPGRSTLTRPPSASAFSNRVLTASSRLNTTTSNMGLSRLSTGLPSSSQMNTSILDRPITQQGIAGIRPGTNRGLPMNRQIQDKRYYEGLIQLKIRELTQEIATIRQQVDSQSRERATFLHYDKRAKEMAAELTELQGQLADYNIVVDKMASNTDKDSIEQEAKELERMNEQTLFEIERMFEQRQQKEQQLRSIENDIESERKNTERIVESMNQDLRSKYDELYKQKMELQDAIDKMQRDLDHLSNEKVRMEGQIALSQVKQEAVKLHLNIMEVEGKRDRLREEEKNRLSPEEEREQLLAKVKQDNTDIAAAERQTTEMKKRMTELEQELERLETDLEENQSEKQVKYKELRKREEAMEQFMNGFDQNREEELEKLEKLERMIVDRLEKLSNSIDNDTYLTSGEEMAILNIQSSNVGNEATNLDQSIEGLNKEHVRLQQTLVKMEMLEKRLKAELIELNEKIDKRQSELVILEDLDGLKASFELKREELIAERAQLSSQQPSCKQELSAVQEEYNEIKARLDKNETYLQITSLEEKVENMKQSNKIIEDFINEQRDKMNYHPLKDRVFMLLGQHNVILKENTKSIY